MLYQIIKVSLPHKNSDIMRAYRKRSNVYTEKLNYRISSFHIDTTYDFQRFGRYAFLKGIVAESTQLTISNVSATMPF